MWTAAPDGETPELETDEACSVAPTRDNLIKRVRKFLVGCDVLDLFSQTPVLSLNVSVSCVRPRSRRLQTLPGPRSHVLPKKRAGRKTNCFVLCSTDCQEAKVSVTC